MNETLTKWLGAVRNWFAGLSGKQRTGMFIGFGTFAVIGAAAFVIAQQDPYQILYSDLQAEEGRAVAKKLGEEKILHNITADFSTVSVPGSQVAKARMELAKAGLPGQDVVGFEKFDGSTLGMSSYVQRIQYIRAVQGELTRSIQQLSSVKRARVHISIPPKKTFLEDEEPAKASVILELKRGQKPSKAEVNGIAHLVSSAVEGLKVSNVSIVDTQGSFLHRPEEEGSAAGMSSVLLENQRSMEAEYEHRVEEILSAVVGLGKVRAKVAAEIDPARVNTTEESFDPDKAAVRNTVRNDETVTGSKPNPIGIPGSRSNLPGAEAVNPPVPMANTSSEKNVQNTSYSIPRKVQVTDKPSGSLKRLTVAVIVDGYYQTVDGKEQFSPRSDDELRRLQDLVANSVGFDEQRRDSITVSCLPFRATEITTEETPAPPATFWNSQPMPIKIGLMAAAALIPLSLAGWLLLRKGKARPMDATSTSYPKTVAQLEAEALGLSTGTASAAGLPASAD
ncbi:flagellar M-ring protein FliF, partial [bacterium]|nr:flagellar M-ring protein FliF [bacterium]